MRLTLATWNINSVRLRIDLVQRFVEAYRPDVLCLQETKCSNDHFPKKAFDRMGYPHQAINGNKGYHGVATVSRLPFAETGIDGYCERADGRHVRVQLGARAGEAEGLIVHNLYVPAGGDEPDPERNAKFAHKLAFVEEMATRFDAPRAARGRTVLVGDLNIAPLENDVWSHRQLLKVVSHTPVEVDRLNRVLGAGPWIDAARHFVAPRQKLYTWWSYRSPKWAQSDKGRRLDHIWLSPDLEGALASVSVLRAARGWPRPSDHVPVTAVLDLEPPGEAPAAPQERVETAGTGSPPG